MQTKVLSVPSLRILSSLFAAALCLCAFATSVRAESAIPGCKQGNPNAFQSIPESDGERIPANTPALLVSFLSSNWKLESAELLDPSGQSVQITISGSHLIHPVQALSEGNGYSLVWKTSCSDYTGPSSETMTRLFDVGPAVSFPTSIGTVAMVQPFPYGVSDAQFNLHLSPEAQAFSSFAVITTSKPGQPINQSFYYGKKAADLSLSWPAPCPTLGHYEDSFQISYSILGLESEVLTLDVPFSYECQKTETGKPDAGPDADSGQADVVVDSSTKDTASSDSSADGPDNIGEHTDAEAAGCTFTHSPKSTWLPLLLLVGSVAVLRRRRPALLG